MRLTRREAVTAGFSSALLALLPLRAFAAADDAIAEFTGGATPTMGGVTLTAPEIAENGNTVPIAVEAPGAVEIRVYADGNPTPAVAAFTFGPLAATAVRLDADAACGHAGRGRGCQDGRRQLCRGAADRESHNRRLRRLGAGVRP